MNKMQKDKIRLKKIYKIYNFFEKKSIKKYKLLTIERRMNTNILSKV